MNSFDFFEEIFCINLDKRKDRWELVQKEFETIDILDRVKRFPAIERKDGRLGCIKSHLEILKYAKKNNLNNVLIFEDDVLFINNVNEVMNNVIDQLPKEWDLLYLGANLHTPLNNISDNLVLLNNGFSTHAISYNKNVYDIFIKKYNIMNQVMLQSDILDVWLASYIQTKGKSYLVKPLLTIQRNDFSDIENKNVNYSFIEERYKKFVN